MNRSGQALMIGVMLVLMLIIAVPAIIFLNQHSTFHGVESQKRLKARAVAEAGIAYAIQQLSQQSAVVGNPPPNWPYLGGAPGLPTTGTFTSIQEVSFTVTYTSTSLILPVPGLQNYQVKIMARPTTWDPVHQQIVPIPGSGISAMVSQQTVGVKLPTGYSSSLAMQLGLVPNVGTTSGDFRVHWGPIAVLDPINPWTLVQAPATQGMNTYQYPRKFAVQGITGAGTATADAGNTDPSAPLTRCPTAACTSTTDQNEYWAYMSPGFSSPINLPAYQILASVNTTGIATPPKCLSTNAPIPPSCPAGNPTCGFFDLSNPLSGCVGGTAVFDNTFIVPAVPNVVVYVASGTAQFNNGLSIDLKPGGAFIVTGNPTATGNLIVNGVLLNAGTQNDIWEPPTAIMEYPYRPTWLAACANNKMQLPARLPRVPLRVRCHFRGFLYVQGNMTVQTASNFQISGVVRDIGSNPGRKRRQYVCHLL